MISSEIVKLLRGTRGWEALQKHIQENIDELDRVSDIEGDDRAVAVEVAARKRAADKLESILEPFLYHHDGADASNVARDRAEDAGL